MNPAALAAIATALLLAGLLLAAAGLVGTRRPATPPRTSMTRLPTLVGIGLPDRQRLWLIVAAVAATVLLWLVTSWPVGGLIAGLAVIGVPWLFTAGRAERRMIAKLEAVASWTRRLRDLVQTGHGLVSAIVTSARTAPAAIGADVSNLAAELQAGADPQHALDRFADRLGEFTADEVIASLKLHANDRGARLAELLGSVADDASEQAISRRAIASDRAEPRFVTQIMTGFILTVLTVLFIDRSYSAPFGHLVGELVLFAAMLVLIGLLVWIRRLSQPAPAQRFLAPVAERHAAPTAVTDALPRREVQI